ncbi:MAG: branched-chain amino acid ABC transporter permease [Nitrospirae bacterium]|nr:MAG: branched-chain amino acid ABC transporter permease [Nitrospirota bacterium]
MAESGIQNSKFKIQDSKPGKIHSPFFIALWLSLLFLPFKGIKAASILFVSLLLLLFIFRAFSGYAKILMDKLNAMRESIIERFKAVYAGSEASGMIAYSLLFVFLFAIPFFAKDYFIDVLILAGIYIILAQGLNIVVGFAGLLNLGFVAFYAIGAYSYALLNTKLGIGFWPALPLSLALVTLSGFVLAVPALRLKGDYLAIVTLGFGEIVRLVFNNWDSLTKGPNGIGGIEPPHLFEMHVSRLSHYYYFILFFVVLTVFIIRRVKASRIGRAWLAIREDEIAAASIGINTISYKLYAFAFGAFWAGLAGVLFAAKMQFVSPESFTFMESVLILCMVILGGLGSIPGIILGSVILVMLPEMLREVQLYRMIALGSGLVLLMIFRPQGIFGGKSVSSGG